MSHSISRHPVHNRLVPHSSESKRNMPNTTNDLPPPINHIFVDYENVHDIDPTIIGSKTVHVTLMLGAKKTKFDATVVEKLMQHVATVEIIRLTSPGRNALDFTLAYYLGRAALADPCGYFHIVSKDKGFDPLIEHLRGKHIRARRHDDFSNLTFLAPAKPSATTEPVVTTASKQPAPPTPAASPASKSPPKPKPPAAGLEELEARVLKYLRKPTTNRPRTKEKLVSDLITHLGKKITKSDALTLIKIICQAGLLVIDDKGKVIYHLD